MKTISFCTILFFTFLFSHAQKTALLNTAKDATYMTEMERDMLYEINRVRHEPLSYLQYLQPMLDKANEVLKLQGKGDANYSLTITTEEDDGEKPITTVDTTWHFQNEEEVKALSTLIADLKKLGSLSILQPDNGIYKAATKHATDQHKHNWKLGHTGTDGSYPWDRITKFSPQMKFGNENIGGRYGYANSTARDMVIQLLVDSGIPGYGHRHNLLDPQWTYGACKIEKFEGMWWWIQNFGVKK